MNERLTMDTIVGLCKRRGFVSTPDVILSSTHAGLGSHLASRRNLARAWGRESSAEGAP